MSKQILILPGDGIGPEIMTEAVKVLELANDKYSPGLRAEPRRDRWCRHRQARRAVGR